jgi:osmotically-inducible protein OsmY
MRADAHIQEDVEAALSRDIYLSNFPIQVTVHNGQVLLTGSVQNLFLRERATKEGMLVPGVVDVDNQLEVLAPESIEEFFELQASGDERTRERVYGELAADPRVESDAIHVSVQSHVVTLTGEVPTMFQRQLAEMNARSVLGVVRVENELSVNAEPREDDDIRRDVQSALASDSGLGSVRIDVRVVGATITLSGEVPDFGSKFRAARVVGRIRGVRGIKNELKVAWSRSFGDETLAKRISERLVHNAQTRWAAKDISVTVKDGVAMLSGRVRRWSEWREAERVARLTDGVRSVNNRLTVRDARE